MSRLRTTRLLPAAAAVLLLALAGCGGQDDTADTASDTSSADTSSSDDSAGSTPDETLALTADGSVAGKCAMPSADTLATFDTAFEGTVTSVDAGTVTLSVDEWYAGDEAATVTVEAPSKELEDLLLAVDFQEGRTYLVSATDDRVTLCGFTAETSPELQAMYVEAFAQ
ncbi:hypothetical protein F4692_002232 [Nocardioides cavernae]|uniref:Lipoprotein n=1 Tax=Nocardioides cavernae TaxID=1921566 RepID=A0A7Y9H355_9ACTN|nr:hypothetical protein [Nocardioides cavernae]NYE37099.1 hypothetical protein [Nocardioides cavernae]